MQRITFERATDYEDALSRAADECGVSREYWDIFQKRHSVSSEVRRQILQALGWKVETFEVLEQQRAEAFRRDADAALPNTVVVGSSDRAIPVSFDGLAEGLLRYEILLESGEANVGKIEVSELRVTRESVLDEQRWKTYLLPLPAEIPLGYHTLKISLKKRTRGRCNLIVCPDRAYLPDDFSNDRRTAGFNVALYGLRSERNWGCGDFTDLKEIVQWAHNEIGFSFIGLNPLHALHNRAPYNTSPYLPLSIFYQNLIYVDIERVPEFEVSSCAQHLLRSPRVQGRIRELREAEFVDYFHVDRLKRCFLKMLFRTFLRERMQNPMRAEAFAEYCAREGDLLHKFALYCALNEVLHKQDRNRWTWLHWPKKFQNSESIACKTFAKQYPRTVAFYKYIQFVIEEQLSDTQAFAKECGMSIGLYHDLAVATDSCGSDLWAYRRFYVNGCRVGAPPDDFSPNGQDWAFPPPNTPAHRDDGYRLYRASIRKAIKHSGALRIDHVMRLFRLFWIPNSATAAEGTYVRDNATDLLGILALESVRNKSIIIGEDLGTVTDEIRDSLSRFDILSYRLFYFEKNHSHKSFKRSQEYPQRALVSSTTHDLPTIVGFWTSADIEARKSAGLIDEQTYLSQRSDRMHEKQRMLDCLHTENLLPPHYPRNAGEVPELDGHLHNAFVGFLAQARSMILLLNQEDLTLEKYQQNLPGSTAEYPNWQRKMRVKIEELRSAPYVFYSAMFRDQLTRTGRRLP
jgi:4-alpha-glucanotransferase